MRKHGVPDQPRSSFAMLRVRDIWNLPPSGPPSCLSKSWYANGGKAGLAWKRARAKSFQTKGSAHVSVESWTGSHMESRGTNCLAPALLCQESYSTDTVRSMQHSIRHLEKSNSDSSSRARSARNCLQQQLRTADTASVDSPFRPMQE